MVFLFYSSWSDNKTREVSNTVWTVFAPIAFVLTFSEIYVYQFSQLPLYGISFGLTALFAIVIFYAGGFGGADAKALMCLALALPFYPTSLLAPLSEISPISQTLFPLSVFSNSVLLAALMTLVMLGYNVLWRTRTKGKLFEGEYENGSIGRKILVRVIPYLWAINGPPNRYDMYDAFTGNWILSFANSSRGMNVLAQNDGSLLVYVLRSSQLVD